MKSIFILRPKLFFSMLMLLLSLIVIGFMQGEMSFWEDFSLAPLPNQPSAAPTGTVSIVIKVPSRLLELYQDGKLYKRYMVAVGKSSTPTPVGEWVVTWKSYRSGDVFGTRFLALNVPWGGYGIHGTNQPWSIGTFASQGCVRMRNKDVEELFDWVPVGTPVRIEGQEVSMRRKLQQEMMGPDVLQLQLRLRTLGYLEGRADGFFSHDTELAVKRFQHDKGLDPTGIADKKTLELLEL